MAGIGRWVFRTVLLWAAAKAWRAYQDKKARERGYSPAK
jgi:hypothetical protein